MISPELASEQDLPNILELQKRAFHDQALIYKDFNLPPLTQTIEDLLGEYGRMTFFKVEEDKNLIASVRCWTRDRTVHIEKLIVEPSAQNQGIGRKVMCQLEERYSSEVDRYQLLTGHKSIRNLHLYASLGYKETGRKPLKTGITLVVMEKQVPGKPNQAL